MKVMVLIRLEMVLPSTVRGCRGYQKVNSVPHEGKRCCKQQKGRTNTAVVVQVLNRVHAQAREWLNVSITMV